MQKLNVEILNQAKKEKMKQLEKELSYLKNYSNSDKIICPFCGVGDHKGKYNSCAKVFKNENGSFFKCFACGRWRKLI